MSTVLVTGGAGYIGSILVPELLRDGHKVTVIDNFLYKQNSLAASVIDPNLEIVVGDVRDQNTMSKLISKHDVIVPLAAIVGAPACNRDATAAESINRTAAISLIDSTSNDQLIIMPTTNSSYGTTPLGQVTTEASPLNPISTYALHKAQVEQHLLDKGNGVSFRLATVFGMSPRMRLDLLVNDMCYRAITDKSVILFEANFVRNYVHVRDVSRGIQWALSNHEAKAEIFNFGLSDANLSKRDLCLKIQQFTPEFTFVENEFGKDPDQRNYIVSNEKIESFGFKFKFDLDTGLRELLKGLIMLKNSVYANV
jgi:nucleoside-diphosphate-sugar epimerase